MVRDEAPGVKIGHVGCHVSKFFSCGLLAALTSQNATIHHN